MCARRTRNWDLGVVVASLVVQVLNDALQHRRGDVFELNFAAAALNKSRRAQHRTDDRRPHCNLLLDDENVLVGTA